MRRSILIGSFIVLFLLVSGLGCKNRGGAKSYPATTLQLWGVVEESGDMQRVTGAYRQQHPKISVEYHKFNNNEYKQKMLEAWAQGLGPDIFFIPSTRIREYLKFIEPMPSTMKAPVQFQQGTIKKETIDEVRTYNGYTPKQVQNTFLDVVGNDVIINGRIYGLPLSVDTLSVYYNKDLLKANNIPLPATNWNELLAQAAVLSRADDKDAIVQSAIALGTTNNIPSVLDIVSALMLQVGITIGDDSGPLFAKNQESLNALNFFLSFAQKGLSNYSWTKDLPNAVDMFTSGRLAYFIGYSYHKQMIQRVNPKLNFDIIPMFKPENVTLVPSYSSYWIMVVAKPPKNASEQERTKAELAWQFIMESTQANSARTFLSGGEQPRTTALKALVSEQMKDDRLGPFAQNLLNAQSWYHGYDYDSAQKNFLQIIDNVDQANRNGESAVPYLEAGADLISQTYRAPRE
ncbi:MAG: hypothetical protein A3B30_01985 [Candidatus Komeilibacteria bacterium RIFCSPLOWO2_01_FULL_52_15]|uniref:ABC transporter substrate-binding protein n=1 Tax=Candidatus Komeilibacteria bacterium RIFCSPLOWO2_01_FULL_52_15 TaxID=1798551 RepID=A0A1G2BU48_9BACT|nr:MAG: hypothetical protein A3B30_01985 [Candidatus Komeilibacteria bacterium RIFCSPLOWO2_01_FULL_52_15]